MPRRIKKLAHELFDACYRVENEIVGQDEKNSRFWARANSVRHAHTLNAILDFARRRETAQLRVLNASGLSAGHQDFSICRYLAPAFDLEWVAFESPRSPYLAAPRFRQLAAEMAVTVRLSDFAADEQLYGDGSYDVVLFTEIAEHLDHGTLLRSLLAARARLAVDGIVIVTTPNLAYVTNRVKLLAGDGDLHYWGDGVENMRRGLWGHIVYYDLKRLTRLLADAGLEVSTAYTFTYGNLKPTLSTRLAGALAPLFRHAGQTLFVTASRVERSPTPFEI
jgi:hypothetical protein